jgi:hypothetical protein
LTKSFPNISHGTETSGANTFLQSDLSPMASGCLLHAQSGQERQVTMKTFVLYGMAAWAALIASSAWAESVYRCPDGTFTNKAERQCPAYEPKEVGRVQSKPNGEQQPVASVTLFDEQPKKR